MAVGLKTEVPGVDPTNLVVIMSDEHDPRYMGWMGHPLVKTPNIDGLAARGRRFVNAYTPCPICVPARASFATGCYVHQTGYWDNAIAYDGRIPSWGHALQTAGVRVESIGKLHYKDDEMPTGFDRQHQPMHIYNSHGMVWGSIRDPLPDVPVDHRMVGDYVGPGESPYTDYDRTTAQIAASWFAEHAKDAGPWVLYIGFVAPHFPFIVPQPYFDMYPLDRLPPRKLDPGRGYRQHPWLAAQDRFWPHDQMFRDEEERLRAVAAYFGLCSFLDSNVGIVLDGLERSGLAAQTRVIYTSDHGDTLVHGACGGKATSTRNPSRSP
ncbi:sulfatase-like hydrolase/transferase [Bradyrhizobium sp. BR13661]|jgi:choline-sulfatase|uniref:sulfatase-like hydrolase/transferase n=1 Tax=Bradyrhizobium sp. BR13661 TaxID=2940622 RepID=UPI00247E55FC|nr:arylsulfatase A-like enzyme [Bradyrhizobium sp. BR13661]